MQEIMELLKRIMSGDVTADAELVELLRRKGLMNDIVKSFVRSILISRNQKVIEKFIQYIAPYAQIADSITGPFPQPDASVDGPIRFAVTELGLPVGFDLEDGHCLFVGQTLSGKTTLLFMILAQALRENIKCWLFVKSKEARKLLTVTKEMVLVDFKRGIEVNPLLPPPGLSRGEWTNVFSDVFIQGFTVFEGTQNFIIDIMNELPEDSNLFDLLHRVESTKCFPPSGRTVHYKESAINRLRGILSGDLGETFKCRKSDLESLVERNVIFEIGNLTASQQMFVTNLLTTWLFKYKLKKVEDAEADRLASPAGPFEITPQDLARKVLPIHYIGLDDANLLFSKEIKRGFYPLSIISDLLATVRHARIYVFCCTHYPNQLGESIKSNAFLQVMFALSSGDDVECMRRSMGIYDLEMKKLCHGLKEREIIVKFSKRYVEPFFARVLEVKNIPAEGVSDKEAYENNERILGAREKTAERKESQEAAIREERQKKEERERTEPKPEETAFLWDIYNRPYVSIKERYDTLKLSASKGDRIADSLVRKGLCRKHKINLGYRGGMATFLELTTEGYEAIGMPVREHLSRGGGFEHDLWIGKISEHLKALRSDWVVSVEKQLKGKSIDIMIEFQNKIIGLEVALTAVHEKINLQKDFGQCGCDYVIVACKNDKVLKEVKKEAETLNDEEKNKVTLCLLHELLKCKSLNEILKSGGEKNEQNII
jgi:hypothetical protein